MTAPTGPGPLTDLARVNKILGRAPEHAEAQDMVDAVNSLVPTWARPGGDGWADHQVVGASLMAARLERRKDSPGGAIPFGIDGGAGFVQSNWPDIAMMLGVGSYAVGRAG